MLDKIIDLLRRADRNVGVALALACITVAGASALAPSTDNHPLPVGRPAIALKLEPEKSASAIMNPSSVVLSTTPVDLSPLLQRIALERMLSEEHCLAEAMYYEARGEGEEGQKAIAEVVFHRMKARGFPHTICGVVYDGAGRGHGCQFSFTCDGELDSPKRLSAWVHAKHLAARILGGLIQLGNETEYAISFHAAGIEPGWTLVRTIQIGNHVFYRRPLHTSSS